MPRPKTLLPRLTRVIVLFVFLVLSLSRGLALHRGYHAPLQVYAELPALIQDQQARVCVGKEWYRFPSSFFLPNDKYVGGFRKGGRFRPILSGWCTQVGGHSVPLFPFSRARTELLYIQSEFRGLLPKPFASIDGTRVIPSAMNHMNRAEPSRYVRGPLLLCGKSKAPLKNHKKRSTNTPCSFISPCTTRRYPWTPAIMSWTLSPRQLLRWSPILPPSGGRCAQLR
jgi:hypothetical protein